MNSSFQIITDGDSLATDRVLLEALQESLRQKEVEFTELLVEKSHDQWMLKDAPLVGLNVCRLVRLVKDQKWSYNN